MKNKDYRTFRLGSISKKNFLMTVYNDLCMQQNETSHFQTRNISFEVISVVQGRTKRGLERKAPPHLKKLL